MVLSTHQTTMLAHLQNNKSPTAPISFRFVMSVHICVRLLETRVAVNNGALCVAANNGILFLVRRQNASISNEKELVNLIS
jgi:hypothetical protein